MAENTAFGMKIGKGYLGETYMGSYVIINVSGVNTNFSGRMHDIRECGLF